MKKITFSQIEIKHLLIAWIGISIAFSIAVNGLSLNAKFLYVILGAMLSIGLGFLLHEIAHKVLAIKYNCFAEFRADFNMLIFSILLSFAGILFAAPGAVHISGYLDKKKYANISAAGPATNLILSLLFLAFSFFFTTSSMIAEFLFNGFWFNLLLGFFNLLPFPTFDGLKIYFGSKKLYFTLAGVAFVMMIAQIVLSSNMK